MKEDTILLLGALAIGGYALYKSDILSGVSDAASGVGDAIGGVGAGVGQIGLQSGETISALIQALGNLGQQGTNTIREIIYEGGESTKEIITNIGDAGEDITEIVSDTTDTGKGIWKGFLNAADYTFNIDNDTNIFAGIGRGIGNVANWVKKQSPSIKDKLSTSNITANVVKSSGSSSKTTTETKTPSGVIKTNTQVPNQFLEKLGYQGQSTASGIIYTKPDVSSVIKQLFNR